jgi:hypothetical protein
MKEHLYLIALKAADMGDRVLVLGAGMLIMSLMLAHAFGPLHGGQ